MLLVVVVVDFVPAAAVAATAAAAAAAAVALFSRHPFMVSDAYVAVRYVPRRGTRVLLSRVTHA